jgi:glyoxylase-like metal-dependent hydrolase (beta-lactamase superfamily II)/8-oxo-dGTP pyrophosphatase MutT (NUDIX family)
MSLPEKPRFRGSAVVVLLRGHGADLETWWVRRSDAVSVMPGFDSFLGGTVEPVDAELPIEGVADEGERVLRACAIREAFEEAGVLIGLAGPATCPPERLLEARGNLLAGVVTFPRLAWECGWRFRADALTFAGRWQTPPFTPMRFDASYFLARAPEGQEPSVHGPELAAGEWIRPLAALDRYHDGRAAFATPILHTLLALAEGEDDLPARLAEGPELAAYPVRRMEYKWGIVLHPMKTRPLPPATHTNAYLVGERELALVDPGSGDPDELESLATLLEVLRVEGRRLKLILLTHHHADHAGGVAAVRERWRVPVAAHAGTARQLHVDQLLDDGDRVHLAPGLGDWDLRVLHTPGHSQGHLSFLHERTRSLFCGDLVPGGKGTVILDPPDGELVPYLVSLERLLTEPVETLFPAHGPPQGAAARRIRWLIDHRLKREKQLLAALGPGLQELPALVEQVYADTPGELWAYAERSLLAHLLKLEAQGSAEREGERWRLGRASAR